MYQLVITLQSALCAADGDGFASVIDTDIVTDQHGIPYLPARRIKGCLKQAASYIGSAQIAAIFGTRGAAAPGSLHISNAKLSCYDAVLTAAKELPPQQVTELFADTIAATALDENSAVKENTLRFIRAVSAAAPWSSAEDPEPLRFVADVEIGEAYVPELKRICKALRHIGYKRNRGFGAVTCTLREAEAAGSAPAAESLDDTKRYTLTYAVRLEEPLMLPGKAPDETQDHVSGQQVIGVLAGAYLKTHPADAAFEALFLNSDVRFSDLNITNDALELYIPVPQYLGKSKDPKDAGETLNMLEKEKHEGRILKPIKTGYVSKQLEVRNASRQRVYHNACDHDGDGGLYTQNCLTEGQLLRGTISAPGAQMRILTELLRTSPLRFGRSKTAQYSQCSLVAVHLGEEQTGEVQIPAGHYTVYALTSDVILTDEYGNYDVTAAALCKALGITGEIDPYSTLKYTVLKGFLTVTGLQKAHIRAIAAGSILIVKEESARTLPEVMYIGEQQNAGLGQVRIFPADKLLDSTQNVLSAPQPATAEDAAIRRFFSELDKADDRKRAAVDFARDYAKQLGKWTAAFIGRVTLMIKQSSDRSDLGTRIDSIKSKTKKAVALDLLKRSEPETYETWAQQKDYLLTIMTVLKYRKKREDSRKEEQA
ncbi:MAG: hypothetical protein K5695_15330 [Oscillospiraceae bacterium]|nr:hypothetical protein [Oscillospiraceae bacterium]